MIDQILFSTTLGAELSEGSRLNVTTQFRDQATRAFVVPTTIHFSIIDPDTLVVKQAEAQFTPAASSVVLISLAATNTLLGCEDEQRELLVIVDKGLATQFTNAFRYCITNVGAIRQ